MFKYGSLIHVFAESFECSSLSSSVPLLLLILIKCLLNLCYGFFHALLYANYALCHQILIILLNELFYWFILCNPHLLLLLEQLINKVYFFVDHSGLPHLRIVHQKLLVLWYWYKSKILLAKVLLRHLTFLHKITLLHVIGLGSLYLLNESVVLNS